MWWGSRRFPRIVGNGDYPTACGWGAARGTGDCLLSITPGLIEVPCLVSFLNDVDLKLASPNP